MKIIFMGTPQFAVPSLDICVKEHDVIGVFTQPDRPSGRGHKLKMSEVKEYALEHNLDIYQPETLRNEETESLIRKLNPDVIVVIAYGQILKKNILDIPKYGCINVHGSVLPKYRGPAPIHWAIVNGEKTTGVTTMYMDEGVDTGDILEISKVDISDDMTSGQLHDILMNKGAEILSSTLKKIKENMISATAQNHDEASYAPLLDKNIGLIDWSNCANKIVNAIRGFNPWPCAASFLEGKRVKIYEAHLGEVGKFGEIGEIVDVSKNGLCVQSSDGIVVLEVLGFPNQKKLHISQYLLGHSIERGLKFSNLKED